MGSNSKNVRDLCEALLRLETPEECRKFLEDLCTPQELHALADRWRVARLLAKGVPYRRIYDQTGVSTATVTRVSRSLTYGAGGYQRALERQKEQ